MNTKFPISTANITAPMPEPQIKTVKENQEEATDVKK